MKSLIRNEKRGSLQGRVNERRKSVLKAFFLFILIIGFQISQGNAQVLVYAGEDWSICDDDVLVLSNLDTELVGISGAAWWETSGDGHFEPSIMFGSALTYVPGPNDRQFEEVELTLVGREFDPNGPIHTDNVTLFIHEFVYLACNDHINFSLDVNCEFLVQVDMLLEGEHPPLNLYTLEIHDQNGFLVANNILTNDHLDQTLNYSIGNQCDLNTCEGTISVRDYYPPVLNCENDTISCLDAIHPDSLGFPLDTNLIDTMYYLGENQYYLEGWDACTDATLHYQDELFPYNCDSAFQELIVRTWTAEDLNGNSSTCADSIFVTRASISDLVLPPSYNNIDSAALECNGDWIALANGNPSPESTGYPILERCNDIVYQYTDTRFQSCGSSFDIFRDWTIMDWCTQELIHWGQIIKIMDTTPPVLLCDTSTVVVGADLYNCYSRTYQLEIPEVYDDCADFTFEFSVYLFGDPTDPATVTILNGNYFVSQLPLGTHTVFYKAVDDCDNESTCSYNLVVVDDVLPYAICDEHTQVALGTNGVARMFATSLDDGSYDNCGIEKFEVQKMTDICGLGQDLWAPFVDFCCEEVGDTILVSMRVTDVYGNFNTCMVEVLVEDKDLPAIICPPDITISCDFYYNPDNLDEYFGKVVTNPEDREDIIINDYYNNGVIGQDGIAFDNCNVRVDTSVVFDLNECNVGKIYRTFTAVDDGNLERSCLQTITIQDPDPFDEEDIIWPIDVEVSGCLELDTDTTITGSPIIDDDECSLVAVSYEDQLFTIVDDACEKVVRTWTVIDWCQFDHNTQDGQWTYTQIIKLYNSSEPQFTSSCDDRDVCIYGYCDGLVELEATAVDDCTPDEDLVWNWRLDVDDNGIFDDFGTGNNFAEIMEEGVYRIHWTVEDKCGNQNHCTYVFTVKDCKLPTPYCISSLTTVVMNNNGMVSVTPEHFDIGSYDNCTADEDLLLSWSPDVLDTLFTVTCDSMGGVPEKTFFLDMWVTDEAGNQDYCSIWLQVQDNFDVCENGTGGLVIGGSVYLAETNVAMENSAVDMECSLTEHSGTSNTNSNGAYIFEQLPAGYDYSVEGLSQDDNCNQGVSTLDLVFIQRHILGLSLLDSPYKMLAADANNTNSISAADILEIRKIILGINDDYPNGDCWKYVPKAHVFNNIYQPWNYPRSIEFQNLNSNSIANDFYAVKTGDVNTSYSPFSTGNEIESRMQSTIVMEDVTIEKDQVVMLPVYAVDFDHLQGFQYTLETNGDAELLGIHSGSLIMNNDNYVIHSASKLALSWNASEEISVDADSPVFYIQLLANKKVKSADVIRISDEIAQSLVISNYEESALNLVFRNKDDSHLTYALYQNEPNPFDNNTVIAFEIPQSQDVKLQIFDTNGKLAWVFDQYLEKGRHEISVSNEELKKTGIYYYTIETKDFVSTRKMIYLR